MSYQPPVETPPVSRPTTPAPSLPVQFTFPIPTEIIVYVLAGLGLALIVALVYFLTRGRLGHPVAKNLNTWLTAPHVDALVLALDPSTREARLVPVKRVGSLYVGTAEPVYLIPVEGGESYVLRGAEKPLIVALRYSKAAVQWIPSVEQLVSLSLAPIEVQKGSELSSVADMEEHLISEVAKSVSGVSGTVYVGPDIRLYVSARIPEVLRVFKEYSSYAASTVLSVLSTTLHAVAEEGYRVIEAHRRLIAVRWHYLIMLPVIAAAAFGLVWLFLHVWR